MFATGAVFAGEHGDCTKQAGNTSKAGMLGFAGESQPDS